jgi:hypothetical protein
MRLADVAGRLPARTVALLVAGVLLTGAFVAVFLLPEYRQAARLRQAIAETRADIAVQTRLAPVRARLRQAEAALPESGLMARPEPLSLTDVGRLVEIFDDLAKPTGLRLTAVMPEANSVGKNGLLAVDLRLLGPLGATRDFFTALGRFAPLVAIESATTLVGQDGRELALKCWLVVR